MGGVGLPDLVGEAERALGLDIEVLARPEYSPAAARAHLDAFADVAAGYAGSTDRPTLGGFLGWLEAALTEERGLDKGYVEPTRGAVQVLTIHRSKGLEFPIVYCPYLWNEGWISDKDPPVFNDPEHDDQRTIDVGGEPDGLALTRQMPKAECHACTAD